MFFKPKFCNQCGDKIERVEWFPWTSRNFCQVCETEHKLYEWLPRILSLFVALVGIFGFGSYLMSGENSRSADDTAQFKTLKSNNFPKTERIATNQARNSSNIVQNAENKTVEQNNVADTNLTLPDVKQIQTPTVQKTENVPVVTAKEPVYFCGAQTKKGTPCSRKVKGGGRCWQHEGQTAMLSAEKLLVSR